VTGAIATPGLYPIVRPDFRLMEAVNLAGGLDNSVKNIYVFRDQPREKVVRDSTGRMPRVGQPPASRPENVPPGPPVSPMALSSMARDAAPPAVTGDNGTGQPTSRLAVPSDQAEQELRNAIEPTTTIVPATTPATSTETQPTTETSRPNWIYVNDQFIEKPATDQAVEPVTTTPPTSPEVQPPSTTEPVNWDELAQEGQQRIIRIPAEKLRNGDPSYNLVIRHNDWVRLDPGPVGKFYLHGNVARPGTYDFMGEDITLRQAITAAGGLGPLAWPTRCSITRRLDEDREEILQLDLARIMEGADPDFYLKPNDLVDVGTHAVAPLLLTIRNSFRLTYGFGFVYDRNFADIDAYIPQQNPRDVRRATLSSRFPGLF
jgi:protein involved in polysaccharide export with SLBB domain